MFRVTIIVVLFVMLSIEIAYATALESRFQTVEKLLTVSSAARHIDESDNSAAKNNLDMARKKFTQAATAADSGNVQQAEKLLDEVTGMVFAATRMLKKDESLVQKDLHDFDTRLSSINALCDAYHNIRKEKDLGDPESSELYPIVQKKLSDAEVLKAQNRLVEGRKVLDEAYVAVKVAIEHLRGGETLIRSLKFETPEDEYHYEIDRNDTHSMLVNVLLKDRTDADAKVRSMVKQFMDKAKDLRLKAEQQAGKGDYQAAINTLDQSTREIVRAIRSAGIYIPG